MITVKTGLMIKAGKDYYFLNENECTKIHKRLMEKSMGDRQTMVFEDLEGNVMTMGYDVIIEVDEDDFIDTYDMYDHLGLLEKFRDEKIKYHSLFEGMQRIALAVKNNDLEGIKNILENFDEVNESIG